jgi:hypothetical protein
MPSKFIRIRRTQGYQGDFKDTYVDRLERAKAELIEALRLTLAQLKGADSEMRDEGFDNEERAGIAATVRDAQAVILKWTQGD